MSMRFENPHYPGSAAFGRAFAVAPEAERRSLLVALALEEEDLGFALPRVLQATADGIGPVGVICLGHLIRRFRRRAEAGLRAKPTLVAAALARHSPHEGAVDDLLDDTAVFAPGLLPVLRAALGC